MRQFRFKGKKSADLVWEIEQRGDTYITRHGILGGVIQEFSDRPGDKGKPGTKAYVDPESNCKFNLEREVRKKLEHGYVEYVNEEPVAEQISSLDFAGFLPKNFAAYKPQTSIEPVVLEKLHKTGQAFYSRKYDGFCHILVHQESGWEIYSRRVDLVSDLFPRHIQQLSDLEIGDVGTILVGEMVCQKEGRDDFKSLSRICRSDPPEARRLIEEKECPEPTFFVFDALYWEGKDLKEVAYGERLKLWKGINLELVRPVEFHEVNPDNWQKVAKEEGWEGFVVTDGKSVPGEKFYSFNGDPKRPKGHHKLKPVYEEDVVIFAASEGTGKRLGGIGAVHVKQIHPDTGEWFYCGKVGSGFKDVDLDELEGLFAELDLPIVKKDKDVEKMELDGEGLVCMVEFGERLAGTQKFRFPVYIRLRDDKKPKECIAQKLAEEE